MNFDFIYSYISLFFTALLSATLLPLGSEILLLYMANLDKYPSSMLLIIASLGNTIGSCINYYLGLNGSDFLLKKRYLTKERLEKSENIFNKYGFFALSISWAPIIGDPVTFIAGVLKYRFIIFLSIVATVKTIRYIVVLMIA